MMKNKWWCLSMCVIISGCMTAQQKGDLPDTMQPDQIKSVMKQVADWQLANPSRHHPSDWTSAALYTGMMAWAQMADTEQYENALMEIGNNNNWQLHRRVFFADDHAVGQMYLEMYEKHQDPRMITPTREQFDHILANPPTDDLRMVDNVQLRWNWCDALFMAPPVLAKLSRLTGDPKYLEYMNSEWWLTTDFLYDKQEHLYYRDSRYFDKREENGQKVFWSRGNGWVFAGLARVLEEMPADYPDRPKYEKLFKEMAAKIKTIQTEDGLWHPSLLDPVTYATKEASGSGFYCYGLAWGINNGYLKESDYLPAVIRAWTGLVGCVHPDGKLGYVQPIGGDPQQVQPDQTEIYAVGSFLLAGSQIYKIAISNGVKTAAVTVKNPTNIFRNSETISLDAKAVLKTVPGLTRENTAVFDLRTNKLLRTQWLEDQLLFQTNLSPNQHRSFWIMIQPDALQVPASDARTYCRFIPERKDDFGWENDKAAYRMYGPALEYETITSGIDAWGKCVPYPVIDKFIKAYNENQIPYHYDHGEGGDFYKVGPTLGCGGMAPLINDKVILPRNFVEWKVIDNGPIRSTFELSYNPWKAGSYTVSEVKRISIDLGSNMNRIECRYAGEDADRLPLAAGIILRDTSDQTWTADQIIAYWLPTDFITGMFGCGVVFGSEYTTGIVKADGHLLQKLNVKVGEPVVYYAGSCWDKNEEFNTYQKWQDYLAAFKQRLENPVIVTMK